jgi:hypothetical protein
MTQITELKRQLSQRVPYEELMTKAEVTRLSNDLHSLRSRSRSKSRRRRPEPTDDVRTAWSSIRHTCCVCLCVLCACMYVCMCVCVCGYLVLPSLPLPMVALLIQPIQPTSCAVAHFITCQPPHPHPPPPFTAWRAGQSFWKVWMVQQDARSHPWLLQGHNDAGEEPGDRRELVSQGWF